MGQKVHPYGFRLGVNKSWKSNWYAKKDYSDLLQEDIKIRKHLRKNLSHAGISNLEIERSASRIRINIHTARPGIIIGKKGLEVDRVKDELQRIIGVGQSSAPCSIGNPLAEVGQQRLGFDMGPQPDAHEGAGPDAAEGSQHQRLPPRPAALS